MLIVIIIYTITTLCIRELYKCQNRLSWFLRLRNGLTKYYIGLRRETTRRKQKRGLIILLIVFACDFNVTLLLTQR